MKKKWLLTGMVAVTACAATTISGCAEKKEGPQTIIIELADPSDMVEEATDATEEESSEAQTAEEASTETIDVEVASQEESNDEPQIDGLSEDISLSYTQIGSDDPIIGMVIADILPDIHATNLEITSVQAYKDEEEVIPAGDLTFSLAVDPDSQVVLYRLDSKGKMTSEQLEVTDGEVSYQTSNCGHWLVLNTNLESVTEVETQTAEVETTLAETKNE